MKKKGSRKRTEDKELMKKMNKDQHSSQQAILVVEEVKRIKERTDILGRCEEEKDLVRPRAQGIGRGLLLVGSCCQLGVGECGECVESRVQQRRKRKVLAVVCTDFSIFRTQNKA